MGFTTEARLSRFVVALFGVAHFEANLFDVNFTKIIFFFLFLIFQVF